MKDCAENVEDLETDLLLEGIYRRFGHDYRGYQRGVLKAKLRALMATMGIRTISGLQDRVMHDAVANDALLRALSARAATFFDDPAYFHALREAMGPWLRSCPSPRIWLAECVSAEEVGALAILLAEEDLHDKTEIFATAENEALLQQASKCRFALDRLPEYEENYRKSGGKARLADYCQTENGRAIFSPQLRSNITWAQYSLATDASFNEFQLIVCRRALPDFGIALRRRTLQLFYDSMPLFGLLSVDHTEELRTAPFGSRYKSVAEDQGLYRRVI